MLNNPYVIAHKMDSINEFEKIKKERMNGRIGDNSNNFANRFHSKQEEYQNPANMNFENVVANGNSRSHSLDNPHWNQN